MSQSEGRSPWVWIGVGCGSITLIVVLAIAAIAFLGVRSVNQLKEEIADPQVRAQKAAEMLGVEEIPAGYYAGPSFSIPLLFDMAMLVDRPPRADGSLAEDTERLFVYVKVIRGGRKWSEYASGEADPMEMLDGQGFQVSRGDVIDRGAMELDGMELTWVSQRGELSPENGRTIEGLVTMMLLKCPGDKRMRIGIWASPDPDPDASIEEADFSGTAADPETIREFMTPFRICPE